MLASSFSSPIICQHDRRGFDQICPLDGGQIGPFVLGERCQQEDRNVAATKKINRARSATLAPTTKFNAKLPNPCTAWDENAAVRIGCDSIDDGFPFLGGKQALCVGQIARRLDDAVHAGALYGIAVVATMLAPARFAPAVHAGAPQSRARAAIRLGFRAGAHFVERRLARALRSLRAVDLALVRQRNAHLVQLRLVRAMELPLP